MKKSKIIAFILVCIIMSTMMLTSCDDVIDNVLANLGLGVDKRYLSGLGIGHSYNLIENDIYNVEKISSNSVLDIDKLVKLGRYTKTDINKTEVDAYSYSSNADKYSQASVHIGFSAGINYGVGNVNAEVSSDLTGAISSHKYNHTYVVSGQVRSQMYVISDISSDEILKQCLTDAFVKDVTAVKDKRMPIEQLYSKYGTHAVVGAVTGGSYTAKYVVSTNSSEVSREASMAFGVSTGNKLGKIAELNMKFDASQNKLDKEKLEGTQTNLSMYYSGSSGAVTLEVAEFNDSIKTYEAGVAQNAMPFSLPENGTIPLADLIRSIGDEYDDTAREFEKCLTEQAVFVFVEEMKSQRDEYYKFEGLFTKKEGGKKIVDENGEALMDISKINVYTLYPQWTIVDGIGHYVLFNPNGGTVNTDFTFVMFGAKYGDLPVPTKSGYAFAGWYLGNTEIKSDTIMTTKGDHTVIAKWVSTKCTYDTGDREIKIRDDDDEERYENIFVDLNIDELKKLGYTKINVSVTINIDPIDCGDQQIWVLDNNGNTCCYKEYYTSSHLDKGGKTETFTFAMSFDYFRIDSYGNYYFVMKYGAKGDMEDRWYLRRTIFYITAQ